MNKSFFINGEEVKVQNLKVDSQKVRFSLDGKEYEYNLIARDGHELLLESNSKRFKAAVSSTNMNGEAMVISHGSEAKVQVSTKRSKKSAGVTGNLTSPMPGKIFKIIKEIGSEVKKGEAILILEAMKMEHSIRADKDGIVKKVFFKVGELVQGGVTLAEVE